jgi:L-ascorbate metabolism protein UlaG (beta-lactamase superfamily)
MPLELTWYGHATWLISTDQHKILLDPFFDDSPTAPIKAAEAEANFILVSHGHFDHVADVASVANRTGAPVYANYEIANWFSANHGIENATGMNIGGAIELPFGKLKMVPALHSSGLPDGSYGGVAAGFLMKVGEKKLYFACDTGLFSDMQLIGAVGLDVAVLPIGDLFTMGPDDSVTAIDLLKPKTVLPSHYNTWPPIQQDASSWAELVKSRTKASPIVLNPGDSYTVE